MTADQQILREIKLLREDLAKLKQSMYKKEKEGEQWVTAFVIMQKYKVDKRDLELLRKQHIIKFKQVRTGVVRYLLSSVEQYFEKQKQAS